MFINWRCRLYWCAKHCRRPLKKKTKIERREQQTDFIFPSTEVIIRATEVSTPSFCYCFRCRRGSFLVSFWWYLVSRVGPRTPLGPLGDQSRIFYDFSWILGCLWRSFLEQIFEDFPEKSSEATILERFNFHSFKARLDRKNQAKPWYCHQKSRFRRSLANPVQESIFHWFWRHFGTLWASTWSAGAIFAWKNGIQNNIRNLSRFSEIFMDFGGPGSNEGKPTSNPGWPRARKRFIYISYVGYTAI